MSKQEKQEPTPKAKPKAPLHKSELRFVEPQPGENPAEKVNQFGFTVGSY